MNVFFINRRIDFAQENILLRFDETIETIKRTMECEIIPVKDMYDDHIKKYHEILKTINSRAYVYLLDTFDFAEFYVPPFLRHLSKDQEIRDHISWMRRDYLIYAKNKKRLRMEIVLMIGSIFLIVVA